MSRTISCCDADPAETYESGFVLNEPLAPDFQFKVIVTDDEPVVTPNSVAVYVVKPLAIAQRFVPIAVV
jgi:hypothetical protein